MLAALVGTLFGRFAVVDGLALVIELVGLVRLLSRIVWFVRVVAGLVDVAGGLGLHPGAAHGKQGGGQQEGGSFHGASPVSGRDCILARPPGHASGGCLIILWAGNP